MRRRCAPARSNPSARKDDPPFLVALATNRARKRASSSSSTTLTLIPSLVRPDARIVRESPTTARHVQAAYQKALRALQTTISGKTRAAPKGPTDLSWEDQFERLRLYLDRLGMTRDVDALRAIHVAGTKGKGSTCAFAEHIMRECGVRTGLYTSPHLVDVRERFRIDGAPVSKAVLRENSGGFSTKAARSIDLEARPRFGSSPCWVSGSSRAKKWSARSWRWAWAGAWTPRTSCARPRRAASRRSGWTTWRCSGTRWPRLRARKPGYSSRASPRSRRRSRTRRWRRYSGARMSWASPWRPRPRCGRTPGAPRSASPRIA